MKRYLPESYDQNRSLFDAFDSLFKPMFFEETREMRTDIKETDSAYLLDIEMPGFDKSQFCSTHGMGPYGPGPEQYIQHEKFPAQNQCEKHKGKRTV